MKNGEVWDQYKSYTKDITELARKLGFAGSAICWVLKSPNGALSSSVLLALAFFVLFFVADILQGLLGALILRGWIRGEEKRIWRESSSLDGEYLKPPWLDYPSFGLFLMKILFLLVGFVALAIEIFSRPGA